MQITLSGFQLVFRDKVILFQKLTFPLTEWKEKNVNGICFSIILDRDLQSKIETSTSLKITKAKTVSKPVYVFISEQCIVFHSLITSWHLSPSTAYFTKILGMLYWIHINNWHHDYCIMLRTEPNWLLHSHKQYV